MASALEPAARYRVEHLTEYEYSTQVAFAQHLAHLTPAATGWQEASDCRLEIDPVPERLHTQDDYFGNRRTYFCLATAHDNLRVRATGTVALAARAAPPDRLASPSWEEARARLSYVAGAPFVPAAEFCFASARVPRHAALRAYAEESFAEGVPLLEATMDLMHRLHRDFDYDAGSTNVATPVLSAFEARSGVCQDFSHVMIGCLRSLGLAAQYVSGYLYTQARFAAGGAADADTVVGADASHAWVAVWCPVNGWVEFDPTNDALPGTGHLRLAVGRDYSDVAPLRGVVQGGGEHELRVAVRVEALEGSSPSPALRAGEEN